MNCATCGRGQQRFEGDKWINGIEGPRCPDCNRERNRRSDDRRSLSKPEEMQGSIECIGEALPVAMFDGEDNEFPDADLRTYIVGDQVAIVTHGFGGPTLTEERARLLASMLLEAADVIAERALAITENNDANV